MQSLCVFILLAFCAQQAKQIFNFPNKMKGKANIRHLYFTMVFMPLLFAVNKITAQEAMVGETATLSVKGKSGESYEWDLYDNVNNVNFATIPGNCPENKAFFTNNKKNGASVQIKCLQAGAYFYKVVARNNCSENFKIGRLWVKNKADEILAVADTAVTEINKTVAIAVLKNDVLNKGQTRMRISTLPQHAYHPVINPDSSVTYTPVANYEGKDAFEYEICTADNLTCSKAWVFVTIGTNSAESLIFYNAITPNADGINDYLKIEGIEKYPNNVFRLYNRWGQAEKIIVNYNNNTNRWEGNNAQNQKLPDGIYWYKVEIYNKKTIVKWVLLRNGK